MRSVGVRIGRGEPFAFCGELLKGFNFLSLPAWLFSKSQHDLKTDSLADLPSLGAHGQPDAGVQTSSSLAGWRKACGLDLGNLLSLMLSVRIV